jgi:hypothetical protein
MRRGLLLSISSIAWALTASAAEVVLGVANHVLTLVVFGAAGGLDAAGSATLVVHFRHALRHDELAERHERRATLVVSLGLLVLGVVTLFESVRRLAAHSLAGDSHAGVVVAAGSMIVLPLLAFGKRRVGLELGSSSLVADAWLSFCGGVLAALAVVGASVGSLPELWWVDPTIAAGIAIVAAVYGTVVLAREQARHRRG